MILFPENTIGCPQRSAYSYSKNASLTVAQLIKGRPRYELRDLNAVYMVDVMFDLSAGQFNAFQTFWMSINHGTDWFQMNLTLDRPTATLMECHATGPFAARGTDHLRWQVTLNMEVVDVEG